MRGGQPLDINYFTIEESMKQLDKMGSKGREVYKSIYEWDNRPYDILWPFFLTVFLVSMISNLYQDSIGSLFNLIPLFYLAFDYAENYFILRLLRNYSKIDIVIASLEYILPLTKLKYYFFYASATLVIVGILKLIISKLFKKNNNSNDKKTYKVSTKKVD
ncbi:hypothetical protein DLAC_09457 [Tieghemostelium lacteum]|uniref:Transmembrane protein n=1 Tax=Tieghemostelium lacteum TaxID=361077 RepID=A0A151Z7F2_TIELA|nr:hypothetical protein DLAC_09457 [Tieghemostelium lacteum]|eukprot:KYQ89890.1 hypothetical protein DLAC_09457 [Tieghemostelium lacteum]